MKPHIQSSSIGLHKVRINITLEVEEEELKRGVNHQATDEKFGTRIKVKSDQSDKVAQNLIEVKSDKKFLDSIENIS